MGVRAGHGRRQAYAWQRRRLRAALIVSRFKVFALKRKEAAPGEFGVRTPIDVIGSRVPRRRESHRAPGRVGDRCDSRVHYSLRRDRR